MKADADFFTARSRGAMVLGDSSDLVADLLYSCRGSTAGRRRRGEEKEKEKRKRKKNREKIRKKRRGFLFLILYLYMPCVPREEEQRVYKSYFFKEQQ